MYRVKKSCKMQFEQEKVKKRRNIEHRKSEHVGRKSEYVLPEGFPNCFGVWKCKIRGIVPVLYESVVERLSNLGMKALIRKQHKRLKIQKVLKRLEKIVAGAN